jgi:4'-phosphopantetheinyl transferase EntD
MIEAILPPQVSVAEAREDDAAAPLFPEEEEIVARAVERRRREFATGRSCARRALAGLGVEEPKWPAGIVGSITHCEGYRAAAAARGSDLIALGIDAEPHAPLPPGLLGDVAAPAEAAALAELSRGRPEAHWDRLLFSAKESAFKAWYPLAGLPLDSRRGSPSTRRRRASRQSCRRRAGAGRTRSTGAGPCGTACW